jgi:quinoprotein glucose dehydrogenase
MNKSIQRLALAAICALANPSFAVPPSEGAAHGDGKATGPSITDAAQLKAQMKVAEGIQVDLFAADPLLANPVCLYVDEAGKVYVCESYRQDKKGIPDNRSWPQWLNDDLASTSIEDRRKMYEKHVTPALLAEWQQNEERIVVLEDTKGAGHADKSTVFADGFKDLLDGTGAGILVRRGDVWSPASRRCIT